MLTGDEREMFLERIVSTYSDNYTINHIKSWKESGYESPEKAVPRAVGQGGSYWDGYSIDNCRTTAKGFEVKLPDGRTAFITNREIAVYALGEVQQSLF